MASEVARPFPFSDGRANARVVLLAHSGSCEGVDHVDLFVACARAAANANADDRIARAWRLPVGAWSDAGWVVSLFEATEIEPHRAEYLALTNAKELSRGRGVVTPLASVECAVEVEREGRGILVHWPEVQLRGAAIANALWRFSVHRKPTP